MISEISPGGNRPPLEEEGAVFDWESLLALLAERRVIPIIGRELLVLSLEGKEVLLEHHLATRLAAAFGIAAEGLSPGFDLNEVAVLYLKRGGQRKKIYPRLKTIIDEDPLPIPTPLKKLVEISAFNFFVSTTFDSLLVEAIDRERHGGEAKTRCLVYSTHAPLQDLPCEIQRLAAPYVYQLFGRLSTSTDSVVTEEDTLEWLHSLQSEKRQPKMLFDELGNNHLLFLGCSFPDWLSRFCLRTLANKRLLPPRETSEVVADRCTRTDLSLALFLRQYETEVFPSGDAVTFVEELNRRWRARRPAIVAKYAGATPPARIERGAVFLSYASGNSDEASRMKTALENEGITVWFDKTRLLAGDAWDRVIRENIRRCSLFMPFISRDALERGEGYFLREWNWAIERAEGRVENLPFILPIALDDTPQDARELPAFLATRQWQRFPGGEPTPEFVARVRDVVRQSRFQEAGYQ